VVTGASGALGARVVARLLSGQQTDRVVGIDVVPASLHAPRFDARVIDLSSRAGPGDTELERAMDGASALVHLAWKLPDGKGSVPADVAVAAELNRRSLARALDMAAKVGVSSVVFVSSATVYGAWPDNNVPLTEDSRIRPNPEFGFAVSKAEAERVLSEWADEHPGVAVAVLRPTVTVGTGDRPLYQALGVTRAPRLGDDGRPVQYLHVDDLTAAVTLAWEKTLRGVYNVAPDAGIPEERARELAGGVARLPVPSRVAGALAAFGWRLWRRGVPPEAQAYATNPWVVAPDRLKAQGWVPAYTSEEALVATDDRPHWDDLPPGKRQNLNLLLVAAAVGLAGGGAAAAVWAIRRRRARRG
jgi:nucleoside-diphosphate-sugar epimerase